MKSDSLENLIIMNGIIVLPVDMNGKLENIQRINYKGENYIMDATIKTALLMPDPPDNFQKKISYWEYLNREITNIR